MSTRDRSKFRRILTRAALLLLAGAIVNVLVAWACAAWSTRVALSFSPYAKWSWPRPVPRDWSECAAIRAYAGAPGVLEITSYGTLTSGSPPPRVRQWTGYYGLPLPSMFSEWREVPSGVPDITHATPPPPKSWDEGLGIPRWMARDVRPGFPSSRRFPTHVQPIQFAFNIVVYAALMLSVSTSARLMRTLRRRARGLCTMCAYDLRAVSPDPSGLLRCPECGHETRPAPYTPPP